MATKSIYKDVRIRDRHLGRSLANALESAKQSKAPQVVFQRTPERVPKEDIRKFFGKADK